MNPTALARMRGPLGGILAVAAFLGVGLSLWFYAWAYAPAQPGSPRKVEVEIPEGSSTARIGGILEAQGVIRSALAFRLVSRLQGGDGRLKAGLYLLGPGMAPTEVLTKLVRGEEVMRTFTVPEGLTVEEIARLLAAKGFGKREDLLAAFSDARLAAEFLPDDRSALRYPLEGYLFPETYRVAARATPHDLAVTLVQGFRDLWTPELAARARAMGLSAHQVLTLASIVEEEARRAEERPLIAGVYWNRLRRGIPLQADPTVQYALGKSGELVLYEDLKVDSPFNTYRNAGLPPGPIASPGRDAILAALHPADVPYLFFVARPDGSHAFAATLAEHNRNVARFIPRR